MPPPSSEGTRVLVGARVWRTAPKPTWLHGFIGTLALHDLHGYMATLAFCLCRILHFVREHDTIYRKIIQSYVSRKHE